MPRFVHCRETSDGVRFREWSSVVDAYTTEPLTREEMVDHLRRSAVTDFERAVDERLDRAQQTGTSALSGEGAAALSEPWETEICQRCGRFHHAFVARSKGRCSQCGEAENDRAHRPPCGGTR